MTSLDWIARTVDTTGRPCKLSPAADGLCPGHRRGCAFWLDEILEKATTGRETVQQGGCAHLWLYAIQLEVRSEAIRTQAGLDKVATALGGGIFVPALPALGDGT